MRVLIYAPAAQMGGARAHVVGVVPELASLAPNDEFLLMAQPALLQDLPELPANWSLSAQRAPHQSFFGRLLWEQRVLPRIADQWRADVLLSFGSFVPLRSPCVTVLEAANALYFTHVYWQALEREPVWLRLQERARWSLLRASLRAAERVLVPTRAMRQDVVVRLPDLIAKVDVALWGVSERFHAAHWTPPRGESVLGVSNHGINKEFEVMVQALAALREQLPDLRLVFTGSPNETRYSRRTVRRARTMGVEPLICFTGELPNTEMPALVSRSRILVYPTWCESFGLPLAEALAMGAPAIAADIPACREVGGNAARYYAPGDAASMASRIHELIEAPDDALALASAARQRGRQFTWRANADGVLQTLRKAVR